MENKEGFIRDFNDLLVKHGAGRYDYLKDTPMEYTQILSPTGGVVGEFVTCCGRCANVHMDSLPAMISDIYRQGVI